MAVRLLLIDDNEDQIAITKRTLNGATGYQVDCALNAGAGLKKLLEQPYDLVLCDYRLPDMSGLELFRQLLARNQDVPFLLITSVGNERLAVEALQMGASDYVVKDVSFDACLPAVIQRSLDRHREKKERRQMEAERNDAIEAMKREKAQLEQMNQIMMNREERILELKQEVNALLHELNRQQKYSA